MEVLKSMLDKDPKKRPSPAELLTHKLLGGELKDTVSQTADNESTQMNKINKSISPKSMTTLKVSGITSPKH